MAPPAMTAEQRAKAAEACTARRALLAEVASGVVSVAEVFERGGHDREQAGQVGPAGGRAEPGAAVSRAANPLSRRSTGAGAPLML